VTRYEFKQAMGYFDIGRVFGTRSELRAGIRAGSQWAKRQIAFTDLPEINGEGYGGVSLSYTYDSRDRDALASKVCTDPGAVLPRRREPGSHRPP
jgi:hypothetical protein